MDTVFTALRPRLMEIFEHLHSHPEISWQEFETHRYIKNLVERAGCRVRELPGGPGLIADLGEGAARVAVRGDMDALWQEVDGSFCANHSCGHDAHMTMALGAMYGLLEAGLPPRGAVRFIFQPAEEKNEGATRMAEWGALDGISHLYGVHLRPIQDLPGDCAAPAIVHGSCRQMQGAIHGEDAHAARPHLTANAIEGAAALIHLLYGIHIDPLVPHSIKMTMLQAGGSSGNIIPGSACFTLDLRAQTLAAMTALERQARAAAVALSARYGCRIDLETHGASQPALVHPEAEAFMARAIEAVMGAQKLRPPVVTSGGDDFHCYTLFKPELKATMLALGCDLKPGLHHPRMTFDREALLTGAAILTQAVLLTLDAL